MSSKCVYDQKSFTKRSLLENSEIFPCKSFHFGKTTRFNHSVLYICQQKPMSRQNVLWNKVLNVEVIGRGREGGGS